MTTNKIEIGANEFFYDNNLLYTFPFPIKEHLLIGQNVLILLDVPYDIVFNENIFCFDSEKLVWQVERQDEHNEVCPFTSMSYDNNTFSGYKWCGIDCKIDLITGKITSSELIK